MPTLRRRVLTIFGSAASRRLRPPDDEPDDLKFGVIFEPGADHDVLGLLEALVKILGTERVDLLDVERASDTARMLAIAEGEAIYQSEPMAYANAAMAADALFMETAWMRARPSSRSHRDPVPTRAGSLRGQARPPRRPFGRSRSPRGGDGV